MGYGFEVNLPPVLVGVIKGENKDPAFKGFYAFSGYGTDEDGEDRIYSTESALLLSPDLSLDGSGSFFKPSPGSPAVAITGPGGQVYITGFYKPPKIQSDSETPTIGEPTDAGGQLINVAGDKVIRNSGDAALILRRGGSVIIHGGAGVETQWLKEQDTISSHAQNINTAAHGFQSTRGRIKPNKPDPETLSIDEFRQQVGASATRIRIKRGYVDSKKRLEFTIANVTDANGTTTGTLKTRETYYDDGHWIGEGPKYQFGGDGADENAVLGKQLKDFLGQLLDILEKFKVLTSYGPSVSVSPDTIVQIEALKAQFLTTDKILSSYVFFTKQAAILGATND